VKLSRVFRTGRFPARSNKCTPRVDQLRSQTRQQRMEPLWSPVVATGSNQRQINFAGSGENQRNPLPPVATGCIRSSMVRRGSTVRVRQRASPKCLQIGISCRLSAQHAGTARVHLWYARRFAITRGRLRTRFIRTSSMRATKKPLQTDVIRCPAGRDSDPLPPGRGSVGGGTPEKRSKALG